MKETYLSMLMCNEYFSISFLYKLYVDTSKGMTRPNDFLNTVGKIIF
jgi:hypothetical protein